MVTLNTLVVERIVEQLKDLPYELQWLEFTHALALSTPRGVPGKRLLRFAGAIPLSEVERMRLAIERGCEQVDINEW